MHTCPTVRTKFDEKGYEAGIVINEADFDPNKHGMFDSSASRPDGWVGGYTPPGGPKPRRGRPPGKAKK